MLDQILNNLKDYDLARKFIEEFEDDESKRTYLSQYIKER
jgi:hypothetical protein